ncbi:isoamylase early set domain-containing protein [Cognaticolwellia beringensis]|uniref:1,4-alpha-glucan branching protein n=1 Tax=Cognaticolwellia beringensis TaxID=1967665 RepID=A0A222G7A3_9GAMM|nr:isoamylase early set domain-containing protein [Cognaticolwellia beringensis]ASP47264.1 1,4-alpha-glucan branching protein [Cognaticolwellia beringensis]|tara:strand:+ start:3239 stop:3535 length:297 start_codon:yes stop_codon:yes gene_type:complete
MLTKKFFKTKDETEVTFEFNRSDVTTAALVGDFNDWQAIEMKFNKNSKSFKTKVRLPKNGVFHFRYLLNDSEWENDDQADQYLANEFGSENSVVLTTP